MAASSRYDYLVVGTGPGGATLAKELASAGRRVLVVERGPRISGTGLLATRKIFSDSEGRRIRSDGGIWIGRTQVLGGSSYVAMGNAVTPPRRILAEWGIDLSAELAEARSDLRVQPMPAHLIGKGTARINQGAQSLGWEMKPTPKCVDFSRCKGCGLCMWGCPTSAKWTAVEFIARADAAGAEVLVNTEVKRVLHRDGGAVGVLAAGRGGTQEIAADNVILCAGALETPRILQNSGIAEAGRSLALDVFQTTYGYTQDVGMQKEPILATYLEALIEERELFTAPYMYVPVVLVRDKAGGYSTSTNLASDLGLLLKAQRFDARRLIGIMTKIRDEMTGEVMNDGTIRKTLTRHDVEKLDEAHEINKQILIAAGADAESVFTGVYESGHPCCTAGIGRVLDENQQTRIKGLYVSDASAFPSPLGMPPILTIVALSKRLAKRLLS